MSSATRPYRFLLRPKWIGFHLLCIAAIVLMVNLAFWQIRRLEQRRDFNAEVRGRSELPIAPLRDVVHPDTQGGDVEWRIVEVTGTYLPDEQVVVVNRGQDGMAGTNVVTPLRLDDGTILLVNRGFVPEPAGPPAAPAGTVTIEARVRASQERRLGQLSDPETGRLTEVQRIDVPRLAQQLPGPTLPVYVDLLASRPPEGDVPIPVPEPDLTEGPHLSYTIQWFIFSVCVAVGWVLAIRRSAKKAAMPPAADELPDGRPDERATPDPAPASASPAPDAGGSPTAPR